MSIMEGTEILKSPKRRNARTQVTRKSLIVAAEKLIAENGLGNVSTRDVLSEAGQRNQSALQYHFGGKEGLIRAVIANRTEALEARRDAMIEALPENPTLRDLSEILVRPLAELACDQDGGREHLIFLSQAVTRPGFDLERAIKGYQATALDRVITLIFDHVPNLPASERRLRLNMVQDLAVITLKRWAALKLEGRTEEDMVAFLSDIAEQIFREPSKGTL